MSFMKFWWYLRLQIVLYKNSNHRTINKKGVRYYVYHAIEEGKKLFFVNKRLADYG